MTSIKDLRDKVVSQIVSGLKSKTNKDYSQIVSQIVDQEITLLFEMARVTPDTQEIKRIGQSIYYHRLQSANFFATVLGNKILGQAILNNLTKYLDSWLRLWFTHKYMLANRQKLEKFLSKNLRVDVPATELFVAIESEALQRNTPTKPLLKTPRQEGG